MTLILDLSKELETRLRTAARAEGTDEVEAVRHLLERALPREETTTPEERARRADELFAQWAAEDAKLTPNERAAEDARWAEIDAELAEGLALRNVDVSDVE